MSESPTPRPVKIAVGLAAFSAIGAVALSFGIFNERAKAPALTPVKVISPEDLACKAAFANTVYSIRHGSKPAAERAAIEAMHNTPAEGNLLLKGCAAAWNNDVSRLEKQAGKPSGFECADNRDILLRLTQITRAGVDDTAALETLRTRAVGAMNNQCAGVSFPAR